MDALRKRLFWLIWASLLGVLGACILVAYSVTYAVGYADQIREVRAFFEARMGVVGPEADRWVIEDGITSIPRAQITRVMIDHGIELSFYSLEGRPLRQGNELAAVAEPQRIVESLGSAKSWTGQVQGYPLLLSRRIAGGGYILAAFVPGVQYSFWPTIIGNVSLALAFALLSYWPVRAWIIRPMQQIRDELAGYSGDLRQIQLPVTRRDDWGDLAQQVNNLTQRIHEGLMHRRQLLRDVSHEIRSPLARLRLTVELLAESEPDRRETLLAAMLRDIEQMSEQAESILETFRSEVVKPSHPVYMSLYEHIQVRAPMWQEHAVQRDCTLSVRVKPIALVLATTYHLERLFDNIVLNAVRHATPKSKIVLTVWQEGGKIRCHVVNYGNSIEERHIPFLFEPFYRANDSRSRDQGEGYGLGLALARNSARAIEGDVAFLRWDGNPTIVEISLKPQPKRIPLEESNLRNEALETTTTREADPLPPTTTRK